MGYRRGKTTQHEGQAIVKVDGLKSRKDTSFYVGKRICYVYSGKAKKTTKPIEEGAKPLSKTRCIWGKVIASHGNSGALRAKFKTNLPPKAIGGKLRVVINFFVCIFKYFRCCTQVLFK